MRVEHQQRPLWRLTACEVVAALRVGRVTPLELVDAAEARWNEVEPKVKCMSVTCFEQAREEARALMAKGFPANPRPGYLYGLPVGIKDSTAVRGVAFSVGSRVYADRVSKEDDPLVAVLRENGAIIIGKTNVPEFCTGGHTENPLHGTTCNPWDTSRSAGGSSGGSAAALAAGVCWLATGSDMAGSLRTPCSFCGVVGLRPSVGRVPQRGAASDARFGYRSTGPAYATDDEAPKAPAAAQDEQQQQPTPGAPPTPEAYSELWRLPTVQGPMARNMADLELLLLAMTPPDQADAAAERIASLHAGSEMPTRVVWSTTLGGVVEIDPQVGAAVRAAVSRVSQLTGASTFNMAGTDMPGGKLKDGHGRDAPGTLIRNVDGDKVLDLSTAPAIHRALRALTFRQMRRLVDDADKAALLGPNARWQIEQGVALTQADVDEAVRAHERMLEQARPFWEARTVLLLPSAVTLPFANDGPLPGCDLGRAYCDWLALPVATTLMGACSVTLPCGLSEEGLPIGLQIVGCPGADDLVMRVAAMFEATHTYSACVPLETVGEGAGAAAAAVAKAAAAHTASRIRAIKHAFGAGGVVSRRRRRAHRHGAEGPWGPAGGDHAAPHGLRSISHITAHPNRVALWRVGSTEHSHHHLHRTATGGDGAASTSTSGMLPKGLDALACDALGVQRASGDAAQTAAAAAAAAPPSPGRAHYETPQHTAARRLPPLMESAFAASSHSMFHVQRTSGGHGRGEAAAFPLMLRVRAPSGCMSPCVSTRMSRKASIVVGSRQAP